MATDTYGPMLQADPAEDPELHELAVSALHAELNDVALIRPNVETDSIYGAVLVVPQIARSGQWSFRITAVAFRVYILFALSCFLQGLLLYMVNKEEIVVDKYGGQMFLCDFGAFMETCEGTACIGPMGTAYAPERLYSWGDVVTRSFVRDSLLALFPDRADDISAKVDPGEYGLEDYWCRMFCVFIYTLSVMEEFLNVIRMGYLLYMLPTQADHWIEYSSDSEGHHKVLIKAAGMPLHWKLFNFIFVLAPKALIFKTTAQTGTTFLMESAKISSVIVNSVGLTFILGIPQLVFNELTLRTTKNLLTDIQQINFNSQQQNSEGVLSKMELKANYLAHKFAFGHIFHVLNGRLCIAIGLCAVQILIYYEQFCTTTEDGHWISQPQFLPKAESTYSVLSVLLPTLFPQEVEADPYWTMPK